MGNKRNITNHGRRRSRKKVYQERRKRPFATSTPRQISNNCEEESNENSFSISDFGPMSSVSNSAEGENVCPADGDISGVLPLKNSILKRPLFPTNSNVIINSSPPAKLRRGLTDKTYSQSQPTIKNHINDVMATIESPNRKIIAENFQVDEEELSDLIEEEETSAMENDNFIMNLDHFSKQMKPVLCHEYICHKQGRMKLVSKRHKAMGTFFHYRCKRCQWSIKVSTHNDEQRAKLNKGTVSGFVSIGTGHEQATECFANMGMHMMAPGTLRKIEEKYYDVAFKELEADLLANIEEAKRQAVLAGDISDGLPWLSVEGDGGWGVRSYNHSMKSNTAWAVLIDCRTGLLLHVATRNRTCIICKKAENSKTTAKEHQCFKNFDGPCTAMEQDMLVDFFSNSEEKHGMRILKYLGDGDSNVYMKLKDCCSYGNLIEKIPCKNHVTRCYTKNLYGLVLNTALKHTDLRKLVRCNIIALKKAANCAIKTCTEDKTSSTAVRQQNLIKDLRNGPYHVFGQHNQCGDWCSKIGTGEENKVPLLKQTPIWKEINRHLDYLVHLSKNLRSDVNTNKSENFMSVTNKFQGAKRVNRSNRRAYAGRTHLSALRLTRGHEWGVSVSKSFSGGNSYDKLLALALRREKRKMVAAANLKRRQQIDPSLRARQRTGCSADSNYGPKASKPDMPEDELKQRMENFVRLLENQVKTFELREEIFRTTIGQFDNCIFREKRNLRLTASNFYRAISLKRTTSVNVAVRAILRPKEIKGAAILFGKENEPLARADYSEKHNVAVAECGLCTNKKYPLLGASPDGFVGKDKVLEIKCPASMKGHNIYEFVANRQGLDEHGNVIITANGKRKAKDPKFSSCCLEIEEKTKKLRLKRSNGYYYQVQGQMAITGRKICDFYVFVSKTNSFLETIPFDQKFWEEKMWPKLNWFCMECLLPERANSRISRCMKVREPARTFDEFMRDQNSGL